MEIHAFYTEEEGLFNSSYRGSFVNLPNCSYIVVSQRRFMYICIKDGLWYYQWYAATFPIRKSYIGLWNLIDITITREFLNDDVASSMFSFSNPLEAWGWKSRPHKSSVFKTFPLPPQPFPPSWENRKWSIGGRVCQWSEEQSLIHAKAP